MHRSKQQPRRHHYLPEFFIKRFSDDDEGLVYVYEKTYDKLGSRGQTAGTICHKEYLYSLGSGSQRSPILENTFSFFETKWAEIFQILDGDLWLANALLPTRDAENHLRLFFSCQFWRTPNRRALALECADGLLELYDQMDPGDILVPMERKDLKRLVKLKRSADSINIIQNFVLPLLTYRSPANEGAIFKLLEKPSDLDEDLLCADVGVCGDTIEEVFSGDEPKLFPLSSKRLLVLAGDGDEITLPLIRTFQAALFKSASRHVFCATKEGLEKHVHRFRAHRHGI